MMKTAVRGGERRIRIKERPIYYFLPAFLVLTILAVYPLFNNLQLSLTAKKTGDFTFANYQRLFSDKQFWNSMEVTLKWVLFTVCMELIMGFFMAALVNIRAPGVKAYRALMIIPWMTPVIAVCAVWKWMYNADYGILSTTINRVLNVNWKFLSSSAASLYCVGIVTTWKHSPFVMLMMLSGLQGISDDVYEAAKLDGCTGLSRLFRITLPLMFPIIRSLLLVNIISAMNQYTTVKTITGGGPARKTQLIQLYIYAKGIEANNFNYGAAASTTFLVAVLIFAVVYIKITEKAEEEMY